MKLNKPQSYLVYAILFIGIGCTQPAQKQETEETGPLFTNEIGIAPYTFRNSFPNGVAATLDTIQSMGFTEIEGGGMDLDPVEYKRLCDERGLRIPSMGVGYEFLRDSMESVITRAKIYGVKYIMVAWIPHKVGEFDIEDAKMAAEDFNAFGKALAAEGLTFCYHAHGYEFQPHESGTLLDYLMANTNPEYVSFEMDIFWIHFGGGDPVTLLRKYPDRWKLMHVKDMKNGIERTLRGLTDPEFDVTLGTGQVDVEGSIRAALEIGVAHYFIEDESSRIIEQIPQSIEYLRKLKE